MNRRSRRRRRRARRARRRGPASAKVASCAQLGRQRGGDVERVLQRADRVELAGHHEHRAARVRQAGQQVHRLLLAAGRGEQDRLVEDDAALRVVVRPAARCCRALADRVVARPRWPRSARSRSARPRRAPRRRRGARTSPSLRSRFMRGEVLESTTLAGVAGMAREVALRDEAAERLAEHDGLRRCRARRTGAPRRRRRCRASTPRPAGGRCGRGRGGRSRRSARCRRGARTRLEAGVVVARAAVQQHAAWASRAAPGRRARGRRLRCRRRGGAGGDRDAHADRAARGGGVLARPCMARVVTRTAAARPGASAAGHRIRRVAPDDALPATAASGRVARPPRHHQRLLRRRSRAALGPPCRPACSAHGSSPSAHGGMRRWRMSSATTARPAAAASHQPAGAVAVGRDLEAPIRVCLRLAHQADAAATAGIVATVTESGAPARHRCAASGRRRDLRAHGHARRPGLATGPCRGPVRDAARGRALRAGTLHEPPVPAVPERRWRTGLPER